VLPIKAPKVGIESQSACPCEVIDAADLAKRWNLPASWIREQTRREQLEKLKGSFAPQGVALAEIKYQMQNLGHNSQTAIGASGDGRQSRSLGISFWKGSP
jgi:hypothetical protein